MLLNGSLLADARRLAPTVPGGVIAAELDRLLLASFKALPTKLVIVGVHLDTATEL
jgi:hypothetical protein